MSTQEDENVNTFKDKKLRIWNQLSTQNYCTWIVVNDNLMVVKNVD